MNRLNSSRKRQQQKTLARNTQILDIYQNMSSEGLIAETQVLQQQAEINRLQTGLLDLKRLRKLTENGLATLLGMPADTLKIPDSGLRSVRPVDVPAGLPSDLLLKSWTTGMSSLVSIPIFDPNVQSRIKVSEAQTRVAEAEYRRTVLGAFEEVENALVNLSNRKQVYAQLQEGMATQLEVLEIERTLLDSEQEMLTNHWQILNDTVSLFKALGGGWPREVVAHSSN
jgi:outer membrane protein TolC